MNTAFGFAFSFIAWNFMLHSGAKLQKKDVINKIGDRNKICISGVN